MPMGYTNNLNALAPLAMGMKTSSLVYQRKARQWTLCGFCKPYKGNLTNHTSNLELDLMQEHCEIHGKNVF